MPRYTLLSGRPAWDAKGPFSQPETCDEKGWPFFQQCGPALCTWRPGGRRRGDEFPAPEESSHWVAGTACPVLLGGHRVRVPWSLRPAPLICRSGYRTHRAHGQMKPLPLAREQFTIDGDGPDHAEGDAVTILTRALQNPEQPLRRPFLPSAAARRSSAERRLLEG
jgi:hypothetical protein